MIISLLVAADELGGIGLNNKLPWHLPADLKYFRKLTLNHIVVMGRKTFQAIGKPLADRINLVLTRDPDFHAPGTMIANTIDDVITIAKDAKEQELFIIGGAEVFKAFLPLADKLYLTRIHSEFESDTFLPFSVNPEWEIVKQERHQPDEKNKWAYSFEEYLIRKPQN